MRRALLLITLAVYFIAPFSYAATDRVAREQIKALQAEDARQKAKDAEQDAALSSAKSADQQIIDQFNTLSARVKALEDAAEPLPPAPEDPPGPPVTPPAPAPAGFPNTSDGKPVMQIGLGTLAYYSLENPFLNLLRLNGHSWTGVKPGARASFATLLSEGAVSPETFLPTKIPVGYTHIDGGLFRYGARYFPAYFAGTYVFDWEGEATARFDFGVATKVIGPNRIEATFAPNDTNWSRVVLTAVSPTFKNPRIYRKEHEALLGAGEIFDPTFLAYARKYKVLRMLDWQGVNVSWVRSADQLARKAHLTWGQSTGLQDDEGKPLPLNAPRGVPIEALFDLSMKIETALWMHFPPYIGAPAAIEDPDYLTGKKLLKDFGKANAVAVLSSGEFRKYADEIARSLKASAYPRNRMLYIEHSNEVWNKAFPFWRATDYFGGLALGASGVDRGWSWGLGYFTAKVSVTVAESFAANGLADQAYRVVLAGQMANVQTTKDALAGFKAYFSERNIDPSPYLKRLGVSTASYYHGAFTWDDPRGVSGGIFPGLSVADWRAKWNAEIAADREGLKKRVADFIISGPDTSVGTLPNLVKRRNEHQKLAEDAGAFFLGDYEGESHDTTSAFSNDATIAAWSKEFRYGPHGERVTKAWADAMKAQNHNAVIANFHGIGALDDPRSASWPWVDGFYGEENGRTRGLAPYLRQ